MMHQCRLIKCNKGTTPKGVVDNGGSCTCVGSGSIWEISVLPSQFCCELKTALKILSFFFKKSKACTDYKYIDTCKAITPNGSYPACYLKCLQINKKNNQCNEVCSCK